VSELGIIEKLRQDHEVGTFDCGQPDLNRFPQRFAWTNQQSHSAQTFVLSVEGSVRGYYSLAAGAVRHDDASDRARKGQPRHPIPVIVLARLAVDHRLQSRGVGAALLKDALTRVAAAADIIGVRAVLVHAKDERARAFYEHLGFDPSPTDPMHLMLVMKELKARLRASPSPRRASRAGAQEGRRVERKSSRETRRPSVAARATDHSTPKR
jgi:GNAT superfamily N-acetyltransferase